MKQIIALLLPIFISISISAQEQGSLYDSTLARTLGADDYGMKSYILVILKTGENKTTDKIMLDSLFKGHMANINQLADSGYLVVAGPLGKNENAYRGIFILNTSSADQAKEWLERDAAIKAKVFDIELYNWYGSAALPAYLPVHAKIEKTKP